MSPLNRGPMMAPRGPPGMRPPMPPRFDRVPPPFPPVMGRGLPPRGSPMFGPVRNRPLPPPPPPRPGPMMSRQVGPPVPPMFGPPRSRPLPQIPPMPPMGMRGPMGPMRSIMRPGPRGVLPPHALPHMRPRFPPNHTVTKGKMNNTKKNNKLEELELKKPWMTDEIRTEIQKKNKLYAKAKKNKGAKEWEEFKDLRNKVTRMIRDAKNEYLAKNPEKAHLYENDNTLEDVDNDDNIDESFSDSEEEQSNPYCEVCDRDFYSEELLEAHIQEHQTCNIDGCQFKAHAKIVEKHISMQHSTGLYQRMKHVTSEEDIDKWIAERKRRYPTAANVKIQEVEQLEKQKRGEIIKLDQHAAGSSKKEQIKKNRKRKRNKRFQMKVIEEGKIVQGEVYRGLLPFAGTAMLEKEERPDDDLVEKTLVNESSEQQFDVSDEDEQVIEQPTTNKSKIDEVQKSQIVIPKTIGLVADYGSDSEYDDPPDEVPVKVLKLDLKEEHQSDKLESQFKVEEPESNIKETLLTSVDNKANVKNEKKFKVKKTPNKTLKSNNAKFSNERLRLLNKLLARSMQHERNIICQCITFIANNNFLEC